MPVGTDLGYNFKIYRYDDDRGAYAIHVFRSSWADPICKGFINATNDNNSDVSKDIHRFLHNTLRDASVLEALTNKMHRHRNSINKSKHAVPVIEFDGDGNHHLSDE